MTLKSRILLLLVALFATICISFCTRDDNPIPIGGNRVVILRLNLPGSKANTRASIETSITSGVVLGLQKVDIYFYSLATDIVYNTQSLDTEQLTASANDGLQITGLHSNVDAVAIVCNDTDAKNLNVSRGERISALYSKPLDIALEQDFDNVTYLGKDENLVQVGTPEGGDDDIDYFSALVTVAPLVARVEISGLACTDFGNIYTSLKLRSVFIENIFSTDINLDYLENAPLSPIPFVATEPSVIGTVSDWWLEILTGINLNQPINTTAWSPIYDNSNPAEPKVGVFAFHIFQSSSVPTLGLHMDATTSSITDYDQYVTFDAYNAPAGAISSFDAGTIYQITLPFVEIDVTDFDDEPTEIGLTITVQEWTIYSNVITTP